MQTQNTQIQSFKAFRSHVPVRNWCITEPTSDESYWTLELCIEEASHFPTRDQWEKASPISYRKAIKRGWLTKCTTHIKDFQKRPAVPAFWTLERCIEAGRKCQKRSEFKKRFHYVYERARLKGWLEQCCSHMK